MPARPGFAASARAAAVVLLALSGAAGPAARGGAAVRLEYRGSVLTRAQVEAQMQRALRARSAEATGTARAGAGQPAAGPDSAAVAAGLAGLVGQLENLGFLDARASATWDSAASLAGETRMVVRVLEGPRLRFRAVRLATGPAADSARFAAALGLEPGSWASPRAVGEALERAVRDAVDHGHPYAELGVSGWTREADGVTLVLNGQLGPLVTVSGTRIEGLRVTSEAVTRKSMGRLIGLPYNRAAAEAARERLAQLGLFRTVTLTGLEGEPDWGRARLVFRVEEPRYNQLEGIVGVQGKGSTVGLARLELGNLLGTGRAVGLRWEGRGPGLTSLAARYAEPLVLGTPLRLEVAIDHQLQDTLWVRTRWGGRVRFPLAASQHVEAGYEQERVVQTGSEVEEADLQNTLFALERSTLDQPLATRRGMRSRIAASQTIKTERLRPAGTRKSQASAAEVATEWHRPLGAANGLTLQLRAAGRFSSQPVLPLFERLPLGGAASLRGYDEEQFRVDRYALSRLEWRRFVGGSGQRVFLFWDHAWMESRLRDPAGATRLVALQRDGVGFGMRLDAAGGLLGLDYGLEPGRPPLEGKIHLQLVTTF
jgi:outer membrane protein assembly factor BamA